MKLFPPVGEVIALIKVNKPGENFEELGNVLLEAGIATSEQILLLLEDVLCVVGNMGQVRARILCNYTKCIVLPLMGLRGNYQEPGIVVDLEINEHKHNGDQETVTESINDIINVPDSESDDLTRNNKGDTWEG